MIRSRVGVTRLQNGHWKSEKATMFTLAVAAPRGVPSSGTRYRSTPSAGAVGAPFLSAAADFSAGALFSWVSALVVLSPFLEALPRT